MERRERAQHCSDLCCAGSSGGGGGGGGMMGGLFKKCRIPTAPPWPSPPSCPSRRQCVLLGRRRRPRRRRGERGPPNSRLQWSERVRFNFCRLGSWRARSGSVAVAAALWFGPPLLPSLARAAARHKSPVSVLAPKPQAAAANEVKAAIWAVGRRGRWNDSTHHRGRLEGGGRPPTMNFRTDGGGEWSRRKRGGRKRRPKSG